MVLLKQRIWSILSSSHIRIWTLGNLTLGHLDSMFSAYEVFCSKQDTCVIGKSQTKILVIRSMRERFTSKHTNGSLKVRSANDCMSRQGNSKPDLIDLRSELKARWVKTCQKLMGAF